MRLKADAIGLTLAVLSVCMTMPPRTTFPGSWAHTNNALYFHLNAGTGGPYTACLTLELLLNQGLFYRRGMEDSTVKNDRFRDEKVTRTRLRKHTSRSRFQ